MHMVARTHDTAALTLLIAVVIVAPPPAMTVSTALVAILASQLGGIAPDIDQPTAPLWRNIAVGRYLGKVFGVLVGGHRFLCHSLVGVALFGALAMLFLDFIEPLMPHIDTSFVWFAFMVGVVSHLIMDSFTKEGVPWLLPLPFKFGFPPMRAWRVTTGKKVETLIVFPLLVTLTVWLCAKHYNTLMALIQSSISR